MQKVFALVVTSSLMACSAGKDDPQTNPALDGSLDGDATTFDVSGLDADGATDDAGPIIPDPTTCAQAAASHTYVGCDFWPTVTDNIVRPDFDYAVVVANFGDVDADVEVTRGGASIAKAKAPAGGLVPIYLPWVSELKGTTSIFPGCPTDVKTATVTAKGGAYHLTTSVPVAVYQFNAIEYAGKGGPPGKNWTAACANNCLGQVKCFSYTNDASLLLPSTALTGNYRMAGVSAWSAAPDPDGKPGFTYPPYFTVTGTKDGTNVTVKLGPKAQVVAGGGVAGAGPGGTLTFSVNAGDVVEVIGAQTPGSDLSGSLIKASQPIQVISGISCTYMPKDLEACDHVEESLLPVETLGRHYFVTAPTNAKGVAGKHVVRFYGNVDGTNLTYPGAKPGGAPSVIDAGQTVEILGVSEDFEVVADHELTIASFQYGAGPISAAAQGDPAQSFMTAVEQYRLKYVFLAPADYDVSFVDVVQPMDAELTLDGAKVTSAPTALSSGFGIQRLKLGAGKGGAHVLSATKPVGIQVMGFGSYTSYQYPGGLNLGRIAPTPVK
ncbi:MAG: IgGFc-binding protein [Myxococcales bacterium]|nr:IgGFc-binding protein [Myxococcales bacterium]